MFRKVMLLGLLIVSSLMGQEIQIVTPPAPIKVGELAIIEVSGIDISELNKASAVVVPSEGVKFYPVKLWNNQPFIFFQAFSPGKYQIKVELNKWRTDLDKGYEGARNAGLDPVLQDELKLVVEKIKPLYPNKTGSGVVEVAGLVPPPEPVPPQPDITEGKRRVVIIREVSLTTEAVGSILLKIRNPNNQLSKHLETKGQKMDILDQNSLPQKYLEAWDQSLKLKNLKRPDSLPYLLILDEESGSLVFGDKFSITSDIELLDLLKKYGG